MKREPLRDLTRTELIQKRGDLQDELFNLRMRQSTKTLENPLRLRVIGREIGRINTILREDELGLRRLAESKTSILGEATGKKSKTE
ncbi:50S ribosomal protein L29 [candidate division GN15 bacterium]|uniref:Large ribosomal subunit protein uL29 n=1 Tax=candidate division GN15 bacterium TaxID=2072418 RepID=A0A855X376_9BACT|nr:MAG: 50S ribosomal protein L29 [candidate division GN15 bacterium]